jgi:signal transduction histidine kinase
MILLVYNDQDFAEHLERYLSQQGYKTQTLHDAEVVEEFVGRQKPELIVLDALLQKINGFELCQRLKENPQVQDIPLIMTSALYISDGDLKTGIQIGTTRYSIQADSCLMKPFAPPELLKHIKYLLGLEIETAYIPTILIVDDEKDIRELLRTSLQRQNYTLLEVANGNDCLHLLTSTTPDIILLDYKLPDISGMIVLKEIRKSLPDIGIVLMTAYGDEDLAAHAIEEHVDAYLRKPFLIETMLTDVRQTLERSRIKLERKQLIAQLRESNREIMKNYAMLEHANRRLRDLDQLKSEFLANIGHELRTPLNSIIGFTELILQGYSGPLSSEQRRQLTMVLNSGNHLLKVLNDVIEVSLLNTGQIVLKNEQVPITALVQEVLHELRSNAEEKHLRLITNIEKDLPSCHCSHEKVKLILYNLVDNAIKFSSSGDIAVSVFSASSLSHDDWRKRYVPDHSNSGGNYLLVSVQDQGIGIQQKNFDILFDEFRQVDGSLTREYNGTGLGLAISKKLVELYGGRIWLESQIAVGSTFYFTVPLSNKK